MLPGEAVADDDVGSAREQVAALGVAGEAQVARGEQLVRLERELIPLLGLLADREQPHLGPLDAENLLREHCAHVRELQQVLRPGVRVRAAVEQHGRAALSRDQDGDRRPHDARQAPQLEQRGGQHGARVPGGDDRLRLSLGDRPHRADEGRVRLAHGLGRLLVHRHDLGRLDERQPLRVEPGGAEEQRPQRAGARVDGAGDDLPRVATAAEGVDRGADMRLRSRGAERLDLAAAVVLARRAGVMRARRRSAVRTRVDARCLDAVLRATLVAAGLRRFPLGDGHERLQVSVWGRGSRPGPQVLRP